MGHSMIRAGRGTAYRSHQLSSVPVVRLFFTALGLFKLVYLYEGKTTWVSLFITA